MKKLNLETSKARGHIILGELKEAYLIAARLNEIDLIKIIKQVRLSSFQFDVFKKEATIVNNTRVLQLCDQLLEKIGKKEGNEIELQVAS